MRSLPFLAAVLVGCGPPRTPPVHEQPAHAKRHPPAPEPDENDRDFDLVMRSNEGPNNICKFGEDQCGTERWGVKIGIDDQAASVHPAASSPTILDLRAEQRPSKVGLCTPRYPAEQEILELHDVRLVCFKWENGDKGDQDFHLVLEDPSDPVVAPEDDPACKLLNPKENNISRYHTVIVEIPDPECLDERNPWRHAIDRARKEFLKKFEPTKKPQRVNEIVSVRGVRFFDVVHGQLGVVESNGIELHPLMGFCVGNGCALP